MTGELKYFTYFILSRLSSWYGYRAASVYRYLFNSHSKLDEKIFLPYLFLCRLTGMKKKYIKSMGIPGELIFLYVSYLYSFIYVEMSII